MENGGFRGGASSARAGGGRRRRREREICWFKYVLFLYYSNERAACFRKNPETNSVPLRLADSNTLRGLSQSVAAQTEAAVGRAADASKWYARHQNLLRARNCVKRSDRNVCVPQKPIWDGERDLSGRKQQFQHDV